MVRARLVVTKLLPSLFHLHSLLLCLCSVLGGTVYALMQEQSIRETWRWHNYTCMSTHLLPETHVQIVLRLIARSRPARPSVCMTSIKGLDELQANCGEVFVSLAYETPRMGCAETSGQEKCEPSFFSVSCGCMFS